MQLYLKNIVLFNMNIKTSIFYSQSAKRGIELQSKFFNHKKTQLHNLAPLKLLFEEMWVTVSALTIATLYCNAL